MNLIFSTCFLFSLEFEWEKPLRHCFTVESFMHSVARGKLRVATIAGLFFNFFSSVAPRDWKKKVERNRASGRVIHYPSIGQTFYRAHRNFACPEQLRAWNGLRIIPSSNFSRNISVVAIPNKCASFTRGCYNFFIHLKNVSRRITKLWNEMTWSIFCFSSLGSIFAVNLLSKTSLDTSCKLCVA